MSFQRKQVQTDKAPTPAGPYSQAIYTDQMIFISGQRPVSIESDNIPSSIKDQTQQVLKNIKSILESKGCSLDNVIKTTVYLSDIKYFDEMNDVYKKEFSEPYPSRTTIGAQLRDIDVEIDVIAILK